MVAWGNECNAFPKGDGLASAMLSTLVLSDLAGKAGSGSQSCPSSVGEVKLNLEAAPLALVYSDREGCGGTRESLQTELPRPFPITHHLS